MSEVRDREERRIKKVKIDMMRSKEYALWSGILMMGKTKIVDGLPTACTDGRDEMYGREFVKGLNDKELAFVVLHENLHKAFRHLTTWRKLWEEDAQLSNQACDYVINLMLVDSDPNGMRLAMPVKDGKRIGLCDERFRGMNAKQVFDILKKEKEQNGGGGGGDGEGGGFDEHDWEGAGKLSDEQVETLGKEIDQALRQGQIAAERIAGKGTSDMDRALQELLSPKINWREELRDFVSSVCRNKDTSSWRRVNRRFIGNDIYMPSIIGESVGRIVVAVDTSGSISNRELQLALSELKSIANDVHPEAIDLLYWGTEVVGHEVYDASNMDTLEHATKPKDGGGTDGACIPAYMKDKQMKPECVIVITDGYVGEWGEYDVPVMWVIVNTNETAPFGKTIHVRED